MVVSVPGTANPPLFFPELKKVALVPRPHGLRLVIGEEYLFDLNTSTVLLAHISSASLRIRFRLFVCSYKQKHLNF